MPNDKKKMQKPNPTKPSDKSKMKRPSLKGQRPSPKMLGTGMAREAAEAMKKHRERMKEVWNMTE